MTEEKQEVTLIDLFNRAREDDSWEADEAKRNEIIDKLIMQLER